MESEYLGWKVVKQPEVPCPMEAHGVHEVEADYIDIGLLDQPDSWRPVSVYCGNCRAPYKFRLLFKNGEGKIND